MVTVETGTGQDCFIRWLSEAADEAPDHPCPPPSSPRPWSLVPSLGHSPLPVPVPLEESLQACPSRFRPSPGISLGVRGSRHTPKAQSQRRSPSPPGLSRKEHRGHSCRPLPRRPRTPPWARPSGSAPPLAPPPGRRLSCPPNGSAFPSSVSSWILIFYTM
ncbi:serine/arginine repetitive matrix protein 1-like [Camelus ferus]|uniref:Serine/arginine repetitive matrix protein 1-like n=1 Tax=Camelus ferus TaxID=419612 RepID=A0A8B8T5D7_CAMFR|nr:serine/arginine repetitive matrix protein 1-like [Camelus ferus]